MRLCGYFMRRDKVRKALAGKVPFPGGKKDMDTGT
jgi:hypothetical protein